MEQDKIAKAFNEWMRRYTEDPSGFNREWQDVQTFLAQEAQGVEPDYGASCAGYLTKLMVEGEAA